MNGLMDKLLTKVASIANQPNRIVTMADKLLSKIVSEETAMAVCVDLWCEWRRDHCYNEPNDGYTTNKSKWCFTNCGYNWYHTGEHCCWLTYPTGRC